MSFDKKKRKNQFPIKETKVRKKSKTYKVNRYAYLHHVYEIYIFKS